LPDNYFLKGKNSVLFDLLLGTVQGLILGPVLYVIFVSPMFKITNLDAFAHDIFFSQWNRSLPKLIIDNRKVNRSHYQMA
jgi:hypothetical protein